jgi:hypothetical protein
MKLVLCLLTSFAAVSAQTGDDSQSHPQVTKADVQIVQRAREILNSPAKWNRADNRVCPDGAKTFSLYCALEQATKEVSANFEHRGAAMQEARFVIDEDLAPGNQYDHRLMNFNNEANRTFDDVRKFFDLLEARIVKRLADPKLNPPEPVPAARASKAQPTSKMDLEILAQARAILDAPAKWNRADNQECPANAKTFSLFCAFRIAVEKVEGSFDNREAAIQESRAIISEIDKDHRYSARLTDFNNDPQVSFEDVSKLFATIQERLSKRVAAK